ATLANGNAAHAPELQDKSPAESMFSCGHWPAAFAVAEQQQLSGRRLLEALIVGYEVASRLGIAFKAAHIRGATPDTCCAIGNAAAAAKMLGLNQKQTVAAMSLAASQAAGILRQTGSGAHVIEAGFLGRSGVCAAELAACGYSGQPDILEGK